MHIDKYKKADGYEDEDGCFYESALDLYQSHFFGFCGCGCNDDNIRYIRDGLQFIESLIHGPDDREKRDKWWVAMEMEGEEVFGNQQAKYFFYYWADKEGLTEHGGSVPGWLTEKGKMVLQDLNEIVTGLDMEEK
jgi:hypothetical protein